MSSINALRQVLVLGAIVAAVVAAGGGQWYVVALLVPGLAAHGAMSLWLRRQRPRDRHAMAGAAPPPPGAGPPAA